MRSFALMALVVAVAGCSPAESQPGPAAKPPAAAPSNTVYSVRGIVMDPTPDGKTITIQHEEIPGYMKAMTMPFDARKTNELAGLKRGDQVKFQMIVTETNGWIENIIAVGHTNLPAPQPVRVVRDVEQLKEGDVVPDYHFTNELGRAVSLSDFKGQPLALTFIFTHCPFPDFCPRMSRNFAETANMLAQLTNALPNWHLLSISFDGANDTPAVLNEYAHRYRYDPQHWSFVTGAAADIDAITEQFGMTVVPNGAFFDHTLRTAVVDAAGKVQRIFIGKDWTADELTAEMVKAAAK